MISIIWRIFNFFSRVESWKFAWLIGFRALTGLLDLAALIAIGYLSASLALFTTKGSDPSRTITLFGLSAPAVNMSSLPQISILILSLFTFKAAFSIYLTRALALMLARIEARAALKISKNYYGAGLPEFRRKTAEEIKFAIQDGSPSAFNGLMNAFSTVLAEGFLFLITMLAFFLVSPVAAIVILLYFAAIAGSIQIFIGGKAKVAAESYSDSIISANSLLEDLHSNFRELTVSNRRSTFFDKIYRARLDSAESSANQTYLAGMPRYIVETALILGAFSIGALQLGTGDLVKTATTLGIFLTGGMRLMAAMLPMVNGVISMKSYSARAVHALDALEDLPINGKNQDHSTTLRAQQEPVGISFTQVSYAQSGRQVLKDVSFKIEPGQAVALIGPSGAGKSTIADLICGLIPPDSGEIAFTSSLQAGSIQNSSPRVAYIPQHPGRIDGTILDNLTLGASERIDEAQLKLALKISHLDDFVSSLPKGLETRIGKRHDKFSGGQFQRIGLARAIYQGANFLVLDEATSALDETTERQVTEALYELRGSMTLFIIAHRLSTVENADIVFYIDQGEIRDFGTFLDLKSRIPNLNVN